MIFGDLPTNLCGVIADRFDAQRDFARGHGRNQPTVRESSCAPKGGLAAAADPNRRTALLIWARQQSQISNRIKLSLKCDLILGPQLFHQHDRFVTAFAALFLAHPRRLEVARVITTDADHEQKPSLAEEIERRKLFGKNNGMARRQHQGAGAELHVAHARGQDRP